MEAEEWFIVRQEEAESLRKREVIGKISESQLLSNLTVFSSSKLEFSVSGLFQE